MKQFSKSSLAKISFTLATSLMLISCGGSDNRSSANNGGSSSNQVTKPIPNKNVIYVCSDGKTDANGSSWETCTAEIQSAIKQAQDNNKDLWFLAGDYNLTQTIVIENKDVKLYGGFKGTENELKDRKLDTNATVLSGNKKILVLKTENLSDKSILDGFVITQGAQMAVADGAGMYNRDSNIAISNVTFSENVVSYSGGAMCNQTSNPTLTNVSFIKNKAGKQGGAIYNKQSNPTIINASFVKNKSDEVGSSGGAIFNDNSNPTFINATFSNNTSNYGGAITNYQSASPTFINITLSQNTATKNGNAIYNGEAKAIIKNSIIWNNGATEIYNIGSKTPTITNSIIKGDSNNNGEKDPLLSEAKTKIINGVTHVYYDLENGSFAINAGNNDDNNESTDQVGNNRKNGVIDIGAVEK